MAVSSQGMTSFPVTLALGNSPPFPTNFVANDGDGRDADASDPGDWVTAADESTYDQCDDGNAGPQDSSWHGSHMAGVAGAITNNASGIAGIGWNIRILPVRALGKCGGSLSDIAEAIRWAAGLSVPGVPANPTPAQVINLSLGGGTCMATLQGAVDAAIAAGAVVVAATGNEGVTNISAPSNCSGVISVTAHTINGENATYANIGSKGGSDPRPSISAPGGGPPIVLGSGGPTDDQDWHGYYIWSTVLFGNTTPNSGGGAGGTSIGPAYAPFTGTSAATPQVAAVAALVKSLLPNATSAQVLSFVISTARPHPDGGACAAGGGLVGQCGPGLLDANAAVRAAALAAAPPPPPVVSGGAPPPTGGGGGRWCAANLATPIARRTFVGGARPRQKLSYLMLFGASAPNKRFFLPQHASLASAKKTRAVRLLADRQRESQRRRVHVSSFHLLRVSSTPCDL